MGINIYESDENSIEINEGEHIENIFFSKYVLVENKEYIKIAYVESVQIGSTETGKPFYRMKFRDVDGNIIIGRLFDVENFEDTGIMANKLNKSLARIKFLSDKYKGEFNLIIYEINPIPKDAVSVEDFFKPLDGLDDDLKFLNDEIKNLNPKYEIIYKIIKQNEYLSKMKDMSTPLWYGRKGGCLRETADIVRQFKTLRLDDNMQSRLISLTIASLYFRSRRIKEMEESDIVFNLGKSITKTVKINDAFWNLLEESGVLYKNIQKDFFTAFAEEGRHTFNVLVGLDTPKTYYSTVIKDFLDIYERHVNLKNEHLGLIDNSYKNYNNSILVRLGG